MTFSEAIQRLKNAKPGTLIAKRKEWRTGLIKLDDYGTLQNTTDQSHFIDPQLSIEDIISEDWRMVKR